MIPKVGQRVRFRRSLDADDIHAIENHFECDGTLVHIDEDFYHINRDDRECGSGITMNGRKTWVILHEEVELLEVISTNIWKGKKKCSLE